jgi:hypothetical protein
MNNYLKLCANDLNLKLQGMTNQINTNKQNVKDNLTYITNFEKMISELVLDHLENFKELKRRLVNIFNNYIINENKFVEKNVDKKKFYLERRSYLESCVRSLKDKFYKNINMHKSDNKRIMKGKSRVYD